MKKTGLGLAVLASVAGVSSAQVVWDWSFGTESGSFVTPTAPAGVSLAAGTYSVDVSSMQVDSSISLTLTGGASFVPVAPVSIVWDGSSVTGFEVAGVPAASLDFGAPTSFITYSFGMGPLGPTGELVTLGPTTIVPELPAQIAPRLVPTPGAAAVVAAGGLMVTRRRR